MTDTRKIVFLRFRSEIPKRDVQIAQISEHDCLRLVILAEDAPDGQWVEFQCEDRVHAVKVVHAVKAFGFDVEITSRRDRVFARRR